MNLRIELIEGRDALLHPEFVMPEVASDKEFDKFLHYAAFADEQLAGVLVSDPRVYRPEILSIAVGSEFEGKGIATALLEYAVYDMLQEYDSNEGMTDNCFTARILGTPENLAAIKRVFEKAGFTVREGGLFYEIEVGEIEGNQHVQNPAVIEKLDDESGKEIFTSLKATDHALVHAFGNHLAEKRLFPGIVIEELDEDLSTFVIEDGQITGCMLFAKESQGVVQNMFLHRNEDKGGDRMGLLRLMTKASCAALKKYPPSTKMSFYSGNGNTKGLLLKLFPDAEPKQEHVIYVLPFASLLEGSDDRHTDDLQLTMLDNDKMVCKNCRFCTDAILSCEKYLQKPDGVLDGGDCKLAEN